MKKNRSSLPAVLQFLGPVHHLHTLHTERQSKLLVEHEAQVPRSTPARSSSSTSCPGTRSWPGRAPAAAAASRRRTIGARAAAGPALLCCCCLSSSASGQATIKEPARQLVGHKLQRSEQGSSNEWSSKIGCYGDALPRKTNVPWWACASSSGCRACCASAWAWTGSAWTWWTRRRRPPSPGRGLGSRCPSWGTTGPAWTAPGAAAVRTTTRGLPRRSWWAGRPRKSCSSSSRRPPPAPPDHHHRPQRPPRLWTTAAPPSLCAATGATASAGASGPRTRRGTGTCASPAAAAGRRRSWSQRTKWTATWGAAAA